MIRVYDAAGNVIERHEHKSDFKERGGFIVRADEILTAFEELQRAIHEFAVDLLSYWPRKNVSATKNRR
ncbi:MAG: hypothetical protein ACREFF_00705 [Candidatus Udaeobacter sp.]